MRMRAALAIALLWCGAASAQETAARLDKVVHKYADARQFMGSVLVARGGEVVLSKGYGSANLEWEIPNTPETKFRVGSITKQFTAACLLLLEERGKLRVEDPISKYVENPPEAWKNITIHHVLTHTSGIPSFTSFPEYRSFKMMPATVERTLGLFRAKPLEFAPGENFQYSNSGYVLLGYVVERVSGMRYADFLRENVLAPLGMKDTDYDVNAKVVPHRASGYTSFGTLVRNADYIDMTVPHGAGALYSTTGDLRRWQQGLFGGKLLSAASLAKMTAPFKNDYAYGVFVRQRNGHKSISHGGGIEGFNAMLAWYPDDGLSVIVLANLNGLAADKMAADLAEAVFQP